MRVLVHSWQKVYRRVAFVKPNVDTMFEAKMLIQEGYKPAGNFHSYNQAALNPKILRLSKERFAEIQYDPQTQTVNVGAAATVREIMDELLPQGRRLINSGNFFEQTIGGALATGTHGFGQLATMADHVQSFTRINRQGQVESRAGVWDGQGILTAAKLATAPLTEFQVEGCVCELGDLPTEPTSGIKAKWFGVLPYSRDLNQRMFVAEYSPLTVGEIPGRELPKPAKPLLDERPGPNWRLLKYLWAIDDRLPMFRKFAQRKIGKLDLPRWALKTIKEDVDAKYDPTPGYATSNPSLLYWLLRPTFNSHNFAFFVPHGIARSFVQAIIEVARLRDSGALKSFIGIRELSDVSRVHYAGNFNEPVYAIDVYVSPRKRRLSQSMQADLIQKFRGEGIRPHLGKTHMETWRRYS